MDKTVLFYWSKGAKTRIKILNIAQQCSKKRQPCFLNQIAEAMKISHAGIKKHVDLLTEEGYLKQINPQGNPVYLEITQKAVSILKEFKK